jgi:hypothetical protein
MPSPGSTGSLKHHVRCTMSNLAKATSDERRRHVGSRREEEFVRQHNFNKHTGDRNVEFRAGLMYCKPGKVEGDYLDILSLIRILYFSLSLSNLIV